MTITVAEALLDARDQENENNEAAVKKLFTRRAAAWTAEVTHNHPEGVKGAGGFILGSSRPQISERTAGTIISTFRLRMSESWVS